jgi:hypothetical protein
MSYIIYAYHTHTHKHTHTHTWTAPYSHVQMAKSPWSSSPFTLEQLPRPLQYVPSSVSPGSSLMESSLRRTPRSDSGPFQTRMTVSTTAGTARRTPSERSVAAVVFCAGRWSFPAIRRPRPHPTAVCVTARRLVLVGSDRRTEAMTLDQFGSS